MVRGNWQRRVEKAEERKAASRRKKARRGDRTANRDRVKAFLRALDGGGDEEDGGRSGWSNARGEGGREVHLWVDSRPGGSSKDAAPGASPSAERADKRGSHKKGGKKGDDDDEEEEAHRSPRGKKGKKNKKGRRVGDDDPEEAAAAPATPGKGSGRKKPHPRSRESFSPGGGGGQGGAEENDEDDAPPLCRGYFFAGKCPSGGPAPGGGGKGGKGGGGGSCLFEHFSGKYGVTMAEVFGLKRPKKSSSAKIPEPASEEALAQLMLSSDAAAAAAEGDDAEGEVDDNADDVKTMDMVYHLMVPFLGAQKDADETKISDAITTTLSQNGCAISSLSYVVIDGHIAFDRHRGGLLTPPKSRADSVGDSDADVNGDSTDALSGEEALYLAHLTSHLPAHILEWVLTFLPDSATASLPRVCRGWRDEIGRSSPELWRTLLRRHGWPEPAPRIEDEVQAEAGGGGDESERDRYRRAFVGHYAGLGSLAALKVGMESLEAKDRALSRRGGRLASSREYACLADIPAGGPDVGGERCVAFKSWSSGKVLGAYNNDNTVRLYEAAAVATSCGAKGGGGGSAICREAVRVRPAPFPVSKRTRCELRAMDLDDDLVGCLFRVVSSRRGGGGGEDDERETGGDSRGKSGAVPVPWLTAARRDDVLCASSSGGRGRGDKAADLEEEELLRKFDLREAVVNFLLSLENRDGVPDDLFHFLARNSPSRVIVDVFPDLVACGGGRFLFEAAIVIPRRGEDEDDDSSDDDDSDHLPPPPALAARRLCLFSVGGGRVTWMCDSDPTLSSQFLGAAVRLGGSGPASARGPCHAAFTSSETAVSVRVAVSRGGDVQLMRSSTEQESVDYAILAWDVTPVSYAFVGWRPVAVTKSHVVVGHTILVSLPGERLLPRMVLMFCPVSFTSEEDESLLPTLTLKRVGEIVDIVPVRDSDHVIVLHCSDNEGAEGDGADLADNGDADVDRPDNLNFTSASLVHVPTQSLVGQPVRLCGEDVSVMLCSGAGTLALDVFGESVVLAGSAVRDVADACLGAGAEQRSEGRDKAEAKKKKKKRLAGHAKGRQKDGFARGMSLRG